MAVTVNDDVKAPSGVYEVKFGSFTTRDDDNTPVAKATDFGLRVFSNFIVQSGQLEGEGLPCGMDLENQLASWCFLFSGVPPQSTDLAEIEEQMKTDKSINVRVNDNGWVQGVFVPKGTFLARFSRFTRRDENTGKPIITRKEYQGELREMIYWQFEIVAGDLTGVNIPGSCRYAINRRGEDLQITSRSSMYNWMSAAGVDFSKVPDFEDLDNILPEIEVIMQQAGVVLSVQVGDTGWVYGGQSAIAPAPQGVSVTPQPAPKAVEAPVKTEQASKNGTSKNGASRGSSTNGTSKASPNGKASTNGKASSNGTGDLRADLVALIGVKADEFGFGVGAQGTPPALTDAGKKFASEKVGPICVELEIPRSFSKMTDEQVKQVMAAVKALKPESDEGDGEEF